MSPVRRAVSSGPPRSKHIGRVRSTRDLLGGEGISGKDKGGEEAGVVSGSLRPLCRSDTCTKGRGEAWAGGALEKVLAGPTVCKGWPYRRPALAENARLVPCMLGHWLETFWEDSGLHLNTVMGPECPATGSQPLSAFPSPPLSRRQISARIPTTATRDLVKAPVWKPSQETLGGL